MRAFVPGVGVLLGLLSTGDAWAQSALVIRDSDPWGYDAVQDALVAANVPYTIVGLGQLGGVDPYDYTMIFILSCQPDALYTEFNQNIAAKWDPWVADGGFLSIHGCNNSCGASTGAVFPQPPGAPVTDVLDLAPGGYNQDPLHPVMTGVVNNPTGNSLAHTGISNTGDPNDVKLITEFAGGGGNTYLFERQWGNGTVLVAGLTYEFAYANFWDARIVLENAIEYGKTHDLCGGLDADSDTVPDECDVCPLFDDRLDMDADQVPDGCDPCPNSFPDDVDADGICDDVDDTDGDGEVDVRDNCDFVPNADQADLDADSAGDACDNCLDTQNPDQADLDLDLVGDMCDVCADGDDKVDPDLDGVPSFCDICPDSSDPAQRDSDGDDWGDGCDCDPLDQFVNGGELEVCDGVDNNCDGATDGGDAADATPWYLDADLDGQGDPDAPTALGCEPPEGYTDNADDCDDSSRYVRVGATDVCDGLDNNCDGVVDPTDCVAVDPGDVDVPDETAAEAGCSGCDTTTAPSASWLALLGLGLIRRRRG